jgi:hypothetical protein
MTKKVRVEVTQEDIRKGDWGMASCCAVSLAVCRALRLDPKSFRVRTNLTTGIALKRRHKIVQLIHPPTVQIFAQQFDDWKGHVEAPTIFRKAVEKPEPFSFTLEVPCPASK